MAMADILLSHGYFLADDEKEQQIMKPYPPLGLLYLSAYLKRAGCSIEVFDSTFSTREALKERLSAASGGVLGLYTNLLTRKTSVEIVGFAKSRGWTVILGGPESANYPVEYLNCGADVIVHGEGEQTLLELLHALRAQGVHRLHDVRGISFRDETGHIRNTAPREQIEDIDSIPWPDRTAIDHGKYLEAWRAHHGMGSVNLITARGCPYRCTWCSHAVFGFTHRKRDDRDCADELEHIRDAYHPDQVWYADDVFTISNHWLYRYAAELKRRNVRIPFETISRADRMMDERVLETLADMGCYRIWIGSESGSQRILDAMKRRVTVEQVQCATKAAQRHGIQVGMFLMWGYDGEDICDIEATIEHVKKSNPDIFLTTVAYPIKNTEYFDAVSRNVELRKSWITATDRDYVVKGRRTRAFYREVDVWLRKEVDAHRLRESDPEAYARSLAEAHTARSSALQLQQEFES